MELLNKTHKEIQEASKVRKAWGKIFMKIENGGVVFSAAAVREFKLEKGKYVHFGYENSEMFLFQNSSKAGFQLFNRDHGVLNFKNKGAVDILMKKLQLSKLPVKLNLEHTGEIFADKSPLIKITYHTKPFKSNQYGN